MQVQRAYHEDRSLSTHGAKFFQSRYAKRHKIQSSFININQVIRIRISTRYARHKHLQISTRCAILIIQSNQISTRYSCNKNQIMHQIQISTRPHHHIVTRYMISTRCMHVMIPHMRHQHTGITPRCDTRCMCTLDAHIHNLM